MVADGVCCVQDSGWTVHHTRRRATTSMKQAFLPQTSLKMEVAGGGSVKPGTDLFCRLTVSAKKPIKILSGKLSFVCRGQCVQFQEASSSGSQTVRVMEETEYGSISTIHPRHHHHRYHPPPQDEPGNVVNHESPEANTVFSCSLWTRLDLPQVLPDSWSCLNGQPSLYGGSVTSTVQAQVTYHYLDPKGFPQGGNKVLSEEQTLRVVNIPVPVERFGAHGVETNETEAPVGVLGTHGRITCLLTARDRLGVLGSDLPLEVLIRNNSLKIIRKVSLTLYKELTFGGNQCGEQFHSVQQEKLVKIKLPRIGPHNVWHREITHFAIPQHCLTSASLLPCSFVTLRFFVRVKVRWWGGSLECPVEVFLGTEAGRRFTPPDSGLSQYDVMMNTSWHI
ncbi:hypothetical protein ACOMHN_002978 [Nucella lapillus]